MRIVSTEMKVISQLCPNRGTNIMRLDIKWLSVLGSVIELECCNLCWEGMLVFCDGTFLSGDKQKWKGRYRLTLWSWCCIVVFFKPSSAWSAGSTSLHISKRYRYKRALLRYGGKRLEKSIDQGIVCRLSFVPEWTIIVSKASPHRKRFGRWTVSFSKIYWRIVDCQC